MKPNLEVEILKILLMPPHGEDISVRDIAKKLDRPASHIFYYLKKMHRQGVLTKEEAGDKGYYKPQPIFGRNIEQTLACLTIIEDELEDPTPTKLSNCLRLFLQLNPLKKE